jgi:hypothetical protein
LIKATPSQATKFTADLLTPAQKRPMLIEDWAIQGLDRLALHHEATTGARSAKKTESANRFPTVLNDAPREHAGNGTEGK